MKYSLTSIFTFLLGFSVFAGGMEFSHISFEEAKALAQKEGKMIFVDAFTTWCGPCKRMAATTFVDDQVGSFFNKNFVNLKIDMEKPEGRAFGQKYPVSAYPTLYFIDGTGEVAHKDVGGKDVEGILKSAEFAMRKSNKSEAYAEMYENGQRDFTFMLNYVKSLNQAKKPSLKISNDYLNSVSDLTSEQRGIFLYEALVEVDSKLFDEYVQAQSIIVDTKGKEAYSLKIMEAAWNTANKANEYDSPSLLKEAKEKVKKYCSDEFSSFDYESDLARHEFYNDKEAYLKTLEKYAKKVIKKDDEKLQFFATNLAKKYKNDSEALKLAEELAKMSLKVEENIEGLTLYAQILHLNKKKDDALKAANIALLKAQEEKKPTRNIEGLIKYIEAS